MAQLLTVFAYDCFIAQINTVENAECGKYQLGNPIQSYKVFIHFFILFFKLLLIKNSICKFDLILLKKAPLPPCENLPQQYVLANHEKWYCLHEVKENCLVMLMYLWENLILNESNIDHKYEGNHSETEVKAYVAFNNKDADEAYNQNSRCYNDSRNSKIQQLFVICWWVFRSTVSKLFHF